MDGCVRACMLAGWLVGWLGARKGGAGSRQRAPPAAYKAGRAARPLLLCRCVASSMVMQHGRLTPRPPLSLPGPCLQAKRVEKRLADKKIKMDLHKSGE